LTLPPVERADHWVAPDLAAGPSQQGGLLSSLLFSAIMSIVQWAPGAWRDAMSEITRVTYRPLLQRNLCWIIGIELGGLAMTGSTRSGPTGGTTPGFNGDAAKALQAIEAKTSSCCAQKTFNSDWEGQAAKHIP